MEILFNVSNSKLIYENVLFSILPLTALISAKCGFKTWLKYEIIVSVLIGLFLIIKPRFVLSLMLNSPLNDKHSYLSALYGTYLIYSILAPLHLINSLDKKVFYGHFWTKIISNALIIFDNIMSYRDGIHWNYKLLCMSTSFAMVQFLINLNYLYKTEKPWGRIPYHDKVNQIAKFDSLFYLLAGLLMYAFPDNTLACLENLNSNESYRSLSRTCGALLLSLSFESFCMSEFIYLNDKKLFMLSRVIGSLSEIFVILNGFYWFKILSCKTFTSFITFSLLNTLIKFYGYAITPKNPKAE